MNNLFEEYGNSELLITDIQFLGLKKQPWKFSRGARTERTYLYDDGSIAVKDSYTYTMSIDGKQILSAERKLEWYDDQAVKIIEKNISQDLNIKGLKSLNREVRQGRIDYLEAAAEQLKAAAPHVPEPYSSEFDEAGDSIEVLFKNYEIEITHYIQRGTDEFKKAINEEVNPIMLKILNLQSYIPDAEFPTGLTIKQAIIYQLTGVKP